MWNELWPQEILGMTHKIQLTLNTVSHGTSKKSVYGCLYEVVDDTCQIVSLWIKHIESESESNVNNYYNTSLCPDFNGSLLVVLRCTETNVTAKGIDAEPKIVSTVSYFSNLNSVTTILSLQCVTHRFVLSTVAADALVLKHQAISTHNADQISIELVRLQTEILYNIRK